MVAGDDILRVVKNTQNLYRGLASPLALRDKKYYGGAVISRLQECIYIAKRLMQNPAVNLSAGSFARLLRKFPDTLRQCEATASPAGRKEVSTPNLS